MAAREREKKGKGAGKEVERGEEGVVMSVEGRGEGMREVGGIAGLLQRS